MLSEYYEAARVGAALAEKDWFGILKLTGVERSSWLQGMVTNDVQKLAAGQGCYAAHLSSQGKVRAHMHILADENELWMTLERATIPNLVSAFDKLLIMEDVQVADVSDEYQILSVIGPKASAVIESWLDTPLALQNLYQHKNFPGCRVMLSDLGFDLWVLRERADKILRGLAASGATAIDHGTWDVLRTEAGIPVYGVDIDETTTMPELGDRGISYDKGCYIGQEVVAKVKYLGHVNRKFVGFVINGGGLPSIKSPVRRDGKEVGYITTTLTSPRMNQSIALGFVSRGSETPNTSVEIIAEGKSHPAKVVELPFFGNVRNS